VSTQEKSQHPIWDPSRNFLTGEDVREDEETYRCTLHKRWGRRHALKGFVYCYIDYLNDPSSGDEAAEDTDDEDEEGDTTEE
jgi:hypothetical protein